MKDFDGVLGESEEEVEVISFEIEDTEALVFPESFHGLEELEADVTEKVSGVLVLL